MSHFVTIPKALRPRQWIKNILLLSGLYFPDAATNSPMLLSSSAVGRAFIGFFVFCALSSTIYILNDIIDAPRDRLHPKKKNRPIASGALQVPVAGLVGIILGVCGLLGALWLSPAFFLCAVAYLGMMIAYSLMLKEVFLVDTMIIAMGFILRAVSGVIVLRTPERYVDLTPWFVICVLFLSLFLAFCKRRGELVKLEEQAHHHRKVLLDYTVQVCDIGISVSATAAILAYALYATYHPRTWMMMSTLPFVIYGIFRYVHLVYARQGGDAPEDALLSDFSLIGCLLMWAMALLLVFYPGR